MTEQKIKHLVRIANTDLIGTKAVLYAMRKIKGVNYMFANMALNIANINTAKKTGTLSDEDIKKIDDIIKNPQKYDVPSWMLNRRKDFETGEDKHILTGDIDFVNSLDIKRLRKIKSYRGLRHGSGHPVRGQRTKSNFRKSKSKGKSTLGVQRKAIKKG
ncbi:MAG: 30S ribosomal protein S13 [Candidatus Woesearchaeota archaeon]|jgi:small subunit ribosomal protein S13|nr:30S ribosomal protein S13 [Candidatus Woesearchaeota archaeon]MDP7324047.1 30S ribosomal protein S13 [Candidatus Woesearchaeota archaeon]MDP7457396.1 30S ribosomal protein S13 [Candidatus Woesearchaeota archaeon]|tara:strand:+ start:278 stop:754 length:477 start_codon:yes stop_codon:yes gene_type:complete